MITVDEIRKKASRIYPDILRDSILRLDSFPLNLRSDKTLSKDFATMSKEIAQLISEAKDRKGYGYTVISEKVKTRSHGLQDIPQSIRFDTLQDFLKFIGKVKEYEEFESNCNLINSEIPELKDWTIKNPLKIVQNQNKWENLLKVCRYFTQNPKPNLYIRELPINVHTKFIERNKGVIRELLDTLLTEHVNSDSKEFEKRFHLKFSEPLIRFKILDKEISQKYFSGIDDLAIPVSQFETLNLPIKRVLVVENKTTLYTALTLPKMDRSIAIFGSGFSVHNLKNAQWFSNVELLYWGDIDVHGFEILSQFRSYFPYAQSMLMDKTTFETFFENDKGTPTNISVMLNLTEEERQLYELLKINNWRLEQEKIPFYWVNENLP
ncbi:Wadjet anti-phage system protein JetD domain-containing protein [Sphingobacterium spiritivorum]|uniref:Wadjet anti-phage system protein JetD domain-containing protein n=1 Tax=Sphingobacterium spiritivorum TaxID=258 RepID=UPI003DA3A436